MHTAFTYDEANEIIEDFEDLVDTEFSLGTDVQYFVQNLVICPFPNAEREKFIDLYTRSNDADMALNGYSGNGYDVLIAACNVDNESEYSFVGIRAFITEKGISYNFPETQHGH